MNTFYCHSPFHSHQLKFCDLDTEHIPVKETYKYKFSTVSFKFSEIMHFIQDEDETL